MPIIAKDSRKAYNPAPEGLHQAVCVDVVDLGMLESPWGPKHTAEIRWQVDLTDEETGKRHLVIQRYNLSLNEKANLCKHLEAWRGRRFTKEEKEGFDVEKLLGVNCQLQVIHNLTDDGRTFANVQAIVPLGKNMIKIGALDYERVKDRPKERGVAADDDPFVQAEEETIVDDLAF